MIRVELPKALNCYVEGKSFVEVQESCATVRDALAEVAKRSPGVTDRVMEETGAVRQHVNVFVDGENIRFLSGLDTPLQADSSIMILSAISGG